MLPILALLLVSAAPAAPPSQAVKPQPPALRFQKSFRLPVKARQAPVAPPVRTKQEPGATVEVRGEARPLETEREQTLREFREWIVANRFRGAAFVPALQSVPLTTASWDQTHPGGFTVAPLFPLGWGY